MSIDTLRKARQEALLKLIEERDFNLESAHRMHKKHADLKKRARASNQKLSALTALLSEAEEKKDLKITQKIGDAIATVKHERDGIRDEFSAYKNTRASRNARIVDAVQKLQNAIDNLRQAEGKKIQDFVPKNSNKSEQTRLALAAEVLQERIQTNEGSLQQVQAELEALLENLSLTLKEEKQPLTYQALQSELQKVQQGEHSSIVSSEELKRLASKLGSLSQEVENLDNKLATIHQSKEKSGLYRLFFPLIAFFIGYTQKKAHHKTLQTQKKEAQVFTLFYKAHDLMLERTRIRGLEFAHEEKVRKATKALENEGQELLNLRRDLHAYCKEIDTLDASEQPKSGSIVVDKAAAATSTFVIDATSEVKKWAEQAATDISQGVQELRDRPEATLKKVGTQLGDAATGFGEAAVGFWNSWKQPSQEKPPEQEPLLSGRDSPTLSSGSISPSLLRAEPIPESVQHVAKALRVFLGFPNTLNLELLIHCMDENATYAIDAPQGFQALLDQTIDLYPELDQRIMDMGEDHTPTTQFK
jgi:hypothetical protein